MKNHGEWGLHISFILSSAAHAETHRNTMPTYVFFSSGATYLIIHHRMTICLFRIIFNQQPLRRKHAAVPSEGMKEFNMRNSTDLPTPLTCRSAHFEKEVTKNLYIWTSNRKNYEKKCGKLK